jgi:hypothetical protein
VEVHKLTNDGVEQRFSVVTASIHAIGTWQHGGGLLQTLQA